MPGRVVVAKELSGLFKALSHPDRIRIVEELGSSELDVGSLADNLNLPGTRVSQHLALMRMARMVEERRVGRRHVYRLAQPVLAQWIVDGLQFLQTQTLRVREDAIRDARNLWSASE